MQHSWNNGNGKYGSRQKRRELIPETCEIPDCEFTLHVTKHRIKPGVEGGKYVPGNVIGLCPNHHWMADHGIIPRWTLFQIVFCRLQLRYRLSQYGQAQAI